MIRPPRWSLALSLLVLVLVAPRGGAGAADAKMPRPWRTNLAWISPAGFDPRTLDGRVTILEFWTFGCINCVRTIPAMRALHERFGREVAVVGIHTPEFDHEKDAANVRRAIEREKLAFPVAQDNAFQAWRAFDNHYWPAIYVLDREGRVRHTHVGEVHVGTPSWQRMLQVVGELSRESPKGR